MLRKFGIWFSRSLLVLVMVSLIFSYISMDIPSMLNGLFEDVFTHSSKEVQNETISNLVRTCSSMQGGKVLSVSQICQNASLLAAIKENCNNYKKMKTQRIEIENEEQIKQTCDQVESGSLERSCSQNALSPDLNKLGELCTNYQQGTINEEKFFAGVLSSPFGNQEIAMPQFKFLEKYHNATDYLNTHRVWYFAAILFFLVALYLLIWDFELFAVSLAGICFSIGLIIMIPYALILIYTNFVGIDTTPIINSIFATGGIVPSSIINVVVLLLSRTYSTMIVILGIILLSIGMAGKGYRMLSPKEEKEDKKSK